MLRLVVQLKRGTLHLNVSQCHKGDGIPGGDLDTAQFISKMGVIQLNIIHSEILRYREIFALAKAIAEALGWEDKYYLISAASGLGVKDLCWDVMTFIIENPVVQAEEAKQPEKVEFMWDDYHRQQLEEIAEEDDEDWDDDWDEDDEEGVEFIYKR